MSFGTPIALLLLLLLPLAAAAYFLMQRRRSKYAVRFTNLDLLASVVEDSPRVRRHVPSLLYLLGLGFLLIGFAGPQVDDSAPRDGTVILVEDVSGSMTATDVDPTRMEAAKDAAHSLVSQLPSGFRVSLVSFSSTVQVRVGPTTDRKAVARAIDSLQPVGGTAIGDAVHTALDLVQQDSTIDQPAPKRGTPTPTPIPTPAPTGDATNAKAVIVLMSDGANNTGRDPLDAADRAKAQGIPIFTIALGTPNGIAEVKDEFGRLRRIPVPPDPGTLQQIAEITGAQFFDAPNADQLKAIYKSLGQAIGSEETTRDISVWFLAAGVIGVAAAGGLSLLWFNRFP